MQRYEALIGIIENDNEREALEAAVAILATRTGNAAIAANNARIDLKSEGVEPTTNAIVWRAGNFPRHDEQGPFWFHTAA